MRNFKTQKGQTLGTTFCGDKGRTLMQTSLEESLMWSLDEDTLCLEDDFQEWRLGDLMDLFLKESSRCSKEEFLRRGWKESRWSEGLSMQLGLTAEGRTFLMR
jgi:hypothetical protein